MEEEIKNLQELSEYFRRLNKKLILFTLISKAKKEYEKYDYKAGREYLIRAYLIDKKNPVIFRGLGCMKQFSGNFNSAIRYFKTALKYSEKQEIEYTLLGMAYYLQDMLDDAVYYFNLAIEKNDNYDKAYEGRNQAMLENHLKIIDLQEALKKDF